MSALSDLKKMFSSEIKKCHRDDVMTLVRKIRAAAVLKKLSLTADQKDELTEYVTANCLKESTMKFPMLQMLAEGKKKKAAADEMDFDMEGGEGDMDSIGDTKDAPKGLKAKGDSMGDKVDKGAVLKFLKGCSPKDRKAIAGKLDAMVVADEEAAAK